jgi:hypothetical protein
VDEKTLHKIIFQSKTIQEDIIQLSGFNIQSGYEFISEFRLQNNMIVDLAVKSGEELIMLIELKGSNIGTNDFVRGMGQLDQYINLPKSKNIFSGIRVSDDFKAVLIIPNSVFINKIIASDFHFPIGGLLYEINEKNFALRTINQSIADNLVDGNNNIKLISSYYFRDNRIFELYILLRHLDIISTIQPTRISRKKIEKKFLVRLSVINNRNWRNAFITLSSLGFIDKDNQTTRIGTELSKLSYEEFCFDIYNNYIEKYVIEIFNALDFCDKDKITISNKKLRDKIVSNNEADVKFLTESNSRYISSWLSILRDDFGCINFRSRNSERKLIYDILKYNKNAIIDEVKRNTIAYDYINEAQKIQLELFNLK